MGTALLYALLFRTAEGQLRKSMMPRACQKGWGVLNYPRLSQSEKKTFAGDSSTITCFDAAFLEVMGALSKRVTPPWVIHFRYRTYCLRLSSSYHYLCSPFSHSIVNLHVKTSYGI